MKKILFVLIVLSSIACLISCGGETESKSNAEAVADKTPTEEPQQKQIASSLKFEAYDIKGTLRKSDEWIGKQPVVINFWGTWCPPCRAEMPSLVKAYEEYKNKGVEFVGIAVGRDTPQTVSQYASQNNVNWEMLMAGQEVMGMVEHFEISSVPSTIFIDKNGKVMKVTSPYTDGLSDKYVGPLNHGTFTKLLDSLIAL